MNKEKNCLVSAADHLRVRALYIIIIFSGITLPSVATAGQEGLDSFLMSPIVLLVVLLPVLFFISRFLMSGKKQACLLSHRVTQSLIDVSSDAVFVVDDKMRIKYFNAMAEKIFGYRQQDIMNKSIVDTLVSSENEHFLKEYIGSCKNEGDVSLHPIQLNLLDDSNNTIFSSLSLAVVSCPKGRFEYIFHVQHNSAFSESEDELHCAIYNDDLTGLPNRHMAAQHIFHGISDAKRNSRNLVVMKLGLDRFKHINDSLGHDVGDQLLVEISERFRQNSRRGDLVSRINGDQFIVTLVDVDKSTNVDNLVRKYLDCFKQPFSLNDHALHISVSLGVACFPNDADSVDGLLRNSESAMFQAKKKGGTGFCYYSQEMRQVSKDRLYLENELRRAIDRKELDVFYQPQVDLKTGRIVGVEALVRWNHPELGAVSPIKFIPVAEEIGLIAEIGQWVMKRSCEDLALMRRSRNEYLRLSVNLSARQFVECDLVESIADILQETRFPPEYLELEITESLFMEDIESVASILGILSKQGIRVSMDDFGTGYSSLSYLKRFPIDTIKVDRSFVKDITTDKDDASIVSATIQMAHSLSLDIVAEGVETEEQLQFLLEQNCDKIQGFYFSRPLSYKALLNLMDENRQIDLGADNVCLVSGYR